MSERDPAGEAKWANYMPLGKLKEYHQYYDTRIAEIQALIRSAMDETNIFAGKRVTLLRGDYCGREGVIIRSVLKDETISFGVRVDGIDTPVIAPTTSVEFFD